MFLLLNFFMDTTDILEEFLIQQKRKNDNTISRKPKPPKGFMDLGL